MVFGDSLNKSAGSNGWSDETLLTFQPQLRASLYIAFSATAVLANILVICLVCRSHRMLSSPKYWLIVLISVCFTFQSAIPNMFFTARLLSGRLQGGCGAWLFTVVYNKYLSTAFFSWGTFLIQLDFLICVLSSAYTRYSRGKVILTLMLITWGTTVASVVFLAVAHRSHDDSNENCRYTIDKKAHIILTGITLYVPITLSVLSCFVAIICRASSKLQKVLATNQDIVDSLNTSLCPCLPPADHLLFLLMLGILCLPSGIVTSLHCFSDRLTPSNNLVAIAALMNDNAGCLAILAWFSFADMRLALLKLLLWKRNKETTQTGDLEDSSELKMYDSYPYCSSVQL